MRRCGKFWKRILFCETTRIPKSCEYKYQFCAIYENNGYHTYRFASGYERFRSAVDLDLGVGKESLDQLVFSICLR